MASELTLEIVTPFGLSFSDTVTSCTIPGELGEFQVLRGHAAMVSLVAIGPLKIETQDGAFIHMAVSGGYCEVKDNVVKVMVESAEKAEDIDVARAEAAKKRAEERLHSKKENVDYERARAALLRAINRLKVAHLH